MRKGGWVEGTRDRETRSLLKKHLKNVSYPNVFYLDYRMKSMESYLLKLGIVHKSAILGITSFNLNDLDLGIGKHRQQT